MGKIISSLLVLVIIFGSLASAKTYNLQECIELARQTDPDLTRFRNAVKSADATLWTQAGQFLPSLSLTGSYYKVNQGAVPQQIMDYGVLGVDTLSGAAATYKTYSAGIRLNYTLFDGFRNIWGYLGSKASKKV